MKRSIEHIIQEYNASLFKICLGYSHSFQDAEDLLQDVFINIWKGLEYSEKMLILKLGYTELR